MSHIIIYRESERERSGLEVPNLSSNNLEIGFRKCLDLF